jgi:hypothetical protein
MESDLARAPSSKSVSKNDEKNHEGVPYCAHCKGYLHDFISSTTHLHSGYLQKRKKAYQIRKSRWFLLLNSGHLVYYSRQEDFGVTLPRGVIHLDKDAASTVMSADVKVLEFQVKTLDFTLELTANGVTDRDEWVSKINDFTTRRKREVLEGKFDAELHGQTIKCRVCDKALDLDACTLAEMDGNVQMLQIPLTTWSNRVWAVLIKDHHVIFYHEQAHVQEYKAYACVHVTPEEVTWPVPELSPEEYAFRLSKQCVLKVSTSEELDDWLDSLGYHRQHKDIDHIH